MFVSSIRLVIPAPGDGPHGAGGAPLPGHRLCIVRTFQPHPRSQNSLWKSHGPLQGSIATWRGGGPVELEIPWKAWHRNVDEPAVPQRPYRTAVFRASAELTCTAPTSIEARSSKHSFAIADAAFVAGFAEGE
jgi:hypothetical protein